MYATKLPLGTAAAAILILLRDFCGNSREPTKLRPHIRYCLERYCHRGSFDVLAMNLWVHLRLQTGKRPKKRSSQKSSGYDPKRVEKHTNVLEKLILHEKCRPRPQDCKTIHNKFVQMFWGYRHGNLISKALLKMWRKFDQKLTKSTLKLFEKFPLFFLCCIFTFFPIVRSKIRYRQRFWRKTQKIAFSQFSRNALFRPKLFPPKTMGSDFSSIAS